jgi:hypothetical protein
VCSPSFVLTGRQSHAVRPGSDVLVRPSRCHGANHRNGFVSGSEAMCSGFWLRNSELRMPAAAPVDGTELKYLNFSILVEVVESNCTLTLYPSKYGREASSATLLQSNLVASGCKSSLLLSIAHKLSTAKKALRLHLKICGGYLQHLRLPLSSTRGLRWGVSSLRLLTSSLLMSCYKTVKPRASKITFLRSISLGDLAFIR